MTLHRWLVNGDQQLNPGDPVCEVIADGRIVTVPTPSDGWIGQHFVEAGQAVPLSGSLGLGSSTYKGARWPDETPRPPESFSAADLTREDRLPNFRAFVSYRRGDAEIAAALVADKIDSLKGPRTAFLAPRSLTLGVDFYEAIHDALHRSAVFLAVIGPTWVTALDERRLTRLESPFDVVRTEVQAALDRGIPVVPVMVEGAALPRPDQLPETMASLGRLQGMFLRTETLTADVYRLVMSLEHLL